MFALLPFDIVGQKNVCEHIVIISVAFLDVNCIVG